MGKARELQGIRINKYNDPSQEFPQICVIISRFVSDTFTLICDNMT